MFLNGYYGYDDSDDDDELVFDPIDDVASDETSEPSHPMQMPLDLRGMPMQPIHPSMGNQPPPGQQLPPHYANPVSADVESLNSANPIDKLYLMQDSYFTQM